LNDDVQGAGFITGFFLGTAVGAMAALLLAPRSGRDMREELVEGSERLRERASSTAQELATRGAKATEQTRKTAREAAQGVKEAARILRRGEETPDEPPEVDDASL
jgi:gas vesicle protein